MAKHLEDAITEAIEMAETSEGGTEGTPGANTPTSKPGTPNQSARSLHSPVP